MEDTLIILKPDAVQRRLLGEIIARFERKGLRIIALKMARISEELCREHYRPHEGKDFYEPLVRYMTSAPVVLVVARGKNSIAVSRKMMGATFGADAEPGTIRGDFAVSNRFNLIHGSDSPESAALEIARFFRPDEMAEFESADHEWTYDVSTGEIV